MLKLILELLVWLTVQLEELLTLTLLFEPAPLPEIIIFVPLTEPEGLGTGDGDPSADGEGLGDGETVGLTEGAGLPEGLGDGLIEGEGLGKFAAAAKVLFKAEALSENNPKTDWFRAKSDKQIKNENKK